MKFITRLNILFLKEIKSCLSNFVLCLDVELLASIRKNYEDIQGTSIQPTYSTRTTATSQPQPSCSIDMSASIQPQPECNTDMFGVSPSQSDIIFEDEATYSKCIPGAQVINIGPFKPLVIALGMWYSTSGLRIKKI